MIVRFPPQNGEWYILRCDEHGRRFGEHPIPGAAKHLSGADHGRLSREHPLAIKELGIRVLNCDATLAKKNNAAAMAVLSKHRNRKGIKITQSSHDKPLHRRSTREKQDQGRSASYVDRGRRSTGPSGRHNRGDFEGIIDPIVGEIYLGYWPPAKNWMPVIALPAAGSCDEIGLPGMVANENLFGGTVPSCYRVDELKGEIAGWADGFEDGGPEVAQRQFPVLYVDGLHFPEKSAVGWLPGRSLKPFDPDDPNVRLVSNYKAALKFLAKRSAEREAQELQPEKTPVVEVGRQLESTFPAEAR